MATTTTITTGYEWEEGGDIMLAHIHINNNGERTQAQTHTCLHTYIVTETGTLAYFDKLHAHHSDLDSLLTLCANWPRCRQETGDRTGQPDQARPGSGNGNGNGVYACKVSFWTDNAAYVQRC